MATYTPFASEYMGPQDSISRWQDLSLLVQGPVTDHIADIFRSDWKFASKATLSCNSPTRQALESDSNGVTQLVASGPDVRNDSLRNAILTAIFRAKRRIWVVTPYFVPDELVLEALCLATARNVDVSIIIPKKSNHRLADLVREGYLTRVQEVGAGVWLYDPRMLHAKAILAHFPFGIYGVPEMSTAGVTEQELTAKKIPYESGTAHLWETARMNSMELLSAF